MKPQKVTELVEIEYWTCNVQTHRHMTLEVAEKRVAKISRPRLAARRWTTEEMADALESYLDGLTFKEIGQKYGITGARASHVVARMASRVKVSQHAWVSSDAWISTKSMRENPEFWKGEIAKIRHLSMMELRHLLWRKQ